MEFGAERTLFRRADVAGMGADVAGRLPLASRMAAALRSGAMTAVQLSEELDAPLDSIAKTARRGDGKRFVRVPGPDGVYRIGLLARPA